MATEQFNNERDQAIWLHLPEACKLAKSLPWWEARAMAERLIWLGRAIGAPETSLAMVELQVMAGWKS